MSKLAYRVRNYSTMAVRCPQPREFINPASYAAGDGTEGTPLLSFARNFLAPDLRDFDRPSMHVDARSTFGRFRRAEPTEPTIEPIDNVA